MGEYFSSYNFPNDLTNKRLNLQDETPNIGAEIIKQLGDIGATYYKTKKEKREKEEVKTVKKKEGQEERTKALLQSDHYEISPEGVKIAQEGGVVPAEFVKTVTKKTGTVADNAQPATEFQIQYYEDMVNRERKTIDPNAEEFKVDRSIPIKVGDIKMAVSGITTGQKLYTGQKVSAASNIPTSENNKASEIAAANAKNVLTASPRGVKPKLKLGGNQNLGLDLQKDITPLIEKAQNKMLGNGKSVWDVIGESKLDRTALILKVSTELTISTQDAEKLVNAKKPTQ